MTTLKMLADTISQLDSFLFLFFSMIIIAITLYLPQHIAFLTNRAWFYYNGDENAKVAIQSVVESASTSLLAESAPTSMLAENAKVAIQSVVESAPSSMLPEKVRETVVAVAGVSSILDTAKEL